MPSTDFQHKKIQDALATAHAVRRGELNPVEGARRLAYLRAEMEESLRGQFRYFQAVDSETELFPFAEDHRARFGSEYLSRLARELAEYIASEGPQIVSECAKLIEFLENQLAASEE